jgi:hypothetical protein
MKYLYIIKNVPRRKPFCLYDICITDCIDQPIYLALALKKHNLQIVLETKYVTVL